MIPTTELADPAGLGTCEAHLCVLHTLQSLLEVGRRLGLGSFA